MTRVFLAIGLATTLGGLAWLGLTLASVASATHTKGVVIRVDRDIGDTGPIYWPTFRFTDAQGHPIERRFSVGIGDEDRFAVGDTVAVLYRRDDPDFVRINDPIQLYLKPMLPIVAGLITWYLARVVRRAARNGPEI